MTEQLKVSCVEHVKLHCPPDPVHANSTLSFLSFLWVLSENMFLRSITLCFAVTFLDEIPLRAIRATDPAPVVRHSLHGFTFVAKYAYGRVWQPTQ